MKKYLLFGGQNYYPCGGMFDAIKTFETVEEAVEFAEIGFGESKSWDERINWGHILDIEKMENVK